MIRAAAIAALVAAQLASAGLTPQEKRGKQIYVRGASPSGSPIFASLGSDAGEIPGEIMPCANCHGLDGRGRPEGGVVPSNIRWSELSKSYGVELEDGRKHPAYDPHSLKRAITMGLDPAGQPLNPAMPRFRMSWHDLADLVAYIEKLEYDQDPGLSQASIRIGVVLPPKEEMSSMANAVRCVLEAYAADVNRGGGVFGRLLELRFLDARSDPALFGDDLQRFIDSEHLFALVASYLVRSEKAASALLAREQMPMVGAFTLFPYTGATMNPYLFYLDAGLPGEIDALLEWAAKNVAKNTSALLLPSGDPEIDTAAETALRKAGWNLDRTAHPAIVLCLDTRNTLEALEHAGLSPATLVLLPGSLQPRGINALPAAIAGRVAVAFSARLQQGREGGALYRKLAAAGTLPADHLATQLLALASMRTLLEGLERAGHDLSREKLVQALEGLYEFRTGITQPITFGPSRRIGSPDAAVVLAEKTNSR